MSACQCCCTARIRYAYTQPFTAPKCKQRPDGSHRELLLSRSPLSISKLLIHPLPHSLSLSLTRTMSILQGTAVVQPLTFGIFDISFTPELFAQLSDEAVDRNQILKSVVGKPNPQCAAVVSMVEDKATCQLFHSSSVRSSPPRTLYFWSSTRGNENK